MKILSQRLLIGDIAVSLFPTVTLLQQLPEVGLRLFLSNRNVYFTLGDYIIGNLIVLASGQPAFLRYCLGKR